MAWLNSGVHAGEAAINPTEEASTVFVTPDAGDCNTPFLAIRIPFIFGKESAVHIAEHYVLRLALLG